MGIESNRESASANVEKKPDIIALLKQHLPSASVEGFSALKPEKQRAVEKKLQDLIQVGDIKSIQEWNKALALEEDELVGYAVKQQKTETVMNGKEAKKGWC